MCQTSSFISSTVIAFSSENLFELQIDWVQQTSKQYRPNKMLQGRYEVIVFVLEIIACRLHLSTDVSRRLEPREDELLLWRP